MQVSMKKCKKRLASVWFAGAGLVFTILFFQTVFGHYESRASEAWGWAFPTVMPTLSLILGVLVSEALSGARGAKKIDRFVFRLALSLSVVYLLSVLLTILLQPVSSRRPADILGLANMWLGPFQGLVTAALGAFFVRAESKKNGEA